MGGVDRVDFNYKMGGVIVCNTHFKVWYKFENLGIYNLMVNQGFNTWNMLGNNESLGRMKLPNWKFKADHSKDIINFLDHSHEPKSIQITLINAPMVTVQLC